MWSEETKGRGTFEFIAIVGTRIIWPKSRDIGVGPIVLQNAAPRHNAEQSQLQNWNIRYSFVGMW